MPNTKSGQILRMLGIVIAILNLAHIHAWAQPSIPLDEPSDQIVLAGNTLSLSVHVGGTAPMTYQWRRYTNTTTFGEISGATNATLILTNFQNTPHRFAVVVSDSSGSATSRLARISVLKFPTITPVNPTASLFANLTLTGNATATNSLTYQWLFNGTPISGATGKNLLLTNVQNSYVGGYALVIDYGFGAITSQVATLKITTYNSLYFYGDSWTDTGGNGCEWPVPNYYRDRACNGPMWPEFLSASLGMTYSNRALNVAHCGDNSAAILAQVGDRIRPVSKPELSLYASYLPGIDLAVMVPGFIQGNYVDPTNSVAINRIINTAVGNVVSTVENLYRKGARSIFYMKQNGTNAGDIITFGLYRAGLVDGYIRSYNARFSAAMDSLRLKYADVRICESDLYTLYDNVSTRPAEFGFTDVITPGLSEQNPAFDGPGASHLYWDNLHATSKFHRYMGALNYDAIRTNVSETLTFLAPNRADVLELKHLLIGRDYTLQNSPDLSRWSDVESFTAAAGTNQIHLASPPDASSQFFRLQWQP